MVLGISGKCLQTLAQGGWSPLVALWAGEGRRNTLQFSPTHPFMFMPQHTHVATHMLCAFPVSVMGCHSCQLHQVTAALRKSLQRLFLAMVWESINCFWKDSLGTIKDALKEGQGRHTLLRPACPAAHLPHQWQASSEMKGTIAELCPPLPTSAQQQHRIATDSPSYSSLFSHMISADQSETVHQTKLSNITKNFKKLLLITPPEYRLSGQGHSEIFLFL